MLFTREIGKPYVDRPVHPLAADKLRLCGQAPEGPDRGRRPLSPAARVVTQPALHIQAARLLIVLYTVFRIGNMSRMYPGTLANRHDSVYTYPVSLGRSASAEGYGRDGAHAKSCGRARE